MTYQFDTVWNACSTALIKEVVAFWKAEEALPKDVDGHGRAKQTIVLARDGDGGIAGISTAYLRVVPRLGQPMYYLRMYFSSEHRGMHTIMPMMKHALKALTEYNSRLAAPEALGVVMEVENTHLRERHPKATWPLGFNFIGYSPLSLPMYAHYFPHAKLLPPVSRRTV